MPRTGTLLTRAQVAERLQVCSRTIARLVASGKLRERRIAIGGRALPRYTEAALQAYVDAGYAG